MVGLQVRSLSSVADDILRSTHEVGGAEIKSLGKHRTNAVLPSSSGVACSKLRTTDFR